MRTLLLPALLLYWFPVVAQSNVYKDFEVDSAAVPRGGMAYLTTFIQTNLRKPIQAEAQGLGGTVIVNGIVEPDGHISSINVIRRLHPDCDREAARVFGLFNAWKPAQKDGKAVRQVVNIPIIVKPNTPFIYINGARISYFDDDRKPLADSSDKARYKQVAPLDSNGFANGDMVVYKTKGANWKEEYRIPFIRQVNNRKGPSGQSTISIGYQPIDKLWDGEVIMLSESGSIMNQSFYKSGIPTGAGVNYSPNGVIIEKREEVEGGFTVTSWYQNGQVREIRLNKKSKLMDKPTPSYVLAYWDQTGRQLIKEGNGRAIYSETIQSRVDTVRQTIFIEQGPYENGFKQGLWTGHYADSSYFYEEAYDKGICTGGKSQTTGGDTIRYTVQEQQPEFQGGLAGLGQFLQQNLRYPPDAQRARAQGKVFVSFVVCTDGTLCDYEVLKSVHPELDREAVRVIQKMSGRWKPGSQRGQKVRVKYNLPINFTLQ